MCTVGLLPQQHALHRANSPPHTPPPPPAPTPEGGRKMASLAIPDELLVDIFLRLATPEDLIRASAACVSFRRLIADRKFLRRFRKIHPPPLLGFLDPVVHRFHPAVRPHRSAPAAGAVALAADFSFAFLPAPGPPPPFTFLPAPARDWSVREVRDGRVLLDRPRRHDSGDGLDALFKEMVVCDPLHRQYLLLPPNPRRHGRSGCGPPHDIWAELRRDLPRPSRLRRRGGSCYSYGGDVIQGDLGGAAPS
ncbi:uncharacterized protein [Triticum aestivum]|uniref:uncharacterized protein isoform X2 n=1 Tax=Triticum aestivum TaxID=4565 RepID=UPI001D0201B3|nr:uncharacterized protein LOC123047361 isoform X2 [Triticum aestivum]